ncbi:MAG TPA: hypothetical protein VLX92_23050 [Kofleriaceae bacterium]|nr:hypothetical protein [Kofleriaceae bacterium]
MLRNLLLAVVIASSACYGETEVAYPGVNLAYVGPGVEVVTDYDYPIFFVDGFYWRWYGGYWYRSPYWDRGWLYAPVVPGGIHGIAHPWTYSHYRPGPGFAMRPAPRPAGGHVGRR